MTVTIAWIVKLFPSQAVFWYERLFILSYGEGAQSFYCINAVVKSA